MSIGFRFAATCQPFDIQWKSTKVSCKKDQSSPGEFTGVPALATRRRYSVCSGDVKVPGRNQEIGSGSSQMRVNATPGCDANP